MIVLSCLVNGACQDAAAPFQPAAVPSAAPVALLPISDALGASAAQPQQEVTTAGYMLIDDAGAALVEGLTFTADGTPHALSDGAIQIWLGAEAGKAVRGALRTAGGQQYGTVRVRGHLEGPGLYGAGGKYRYQLIPSAIEPLAAQETTIAELLDHPSVYQDRLVRVAGSLLARDTSALLVDHLSAGGLPEPKARQVKLRTPLRDQELPNRLRRTSAGAIRFGQVQVEGFWHNGVIVPLSIVLVT
jgi:hypothetical protein